MTISKYSTYRCSVKQVDEVDERSFKFWSAICCLEIGIPFLSTFTLNANYQLMETGLAPAASDALGFGPVQISSIFGGNAVLIFLAILFTFAMSAKGVSDEALLMTGWIISCFGYTAMYVLWEADTTVVKFVAPIVLSTLVGAVIYGMRIVDMSRDLD
jgi:hypothetical protein